MHPNPFFDLALTQAQKASHLSPPNPSVGCVLVSPTGKIIGEGHTQAVGGAHAEVMALRDAAVHGESTVGATVYVTLEPCSHFGRTPPCCNALIEAKVGKVVIAMLDPNPLVAGKGIKLLQKAGIEVGVLPADHPQAIAAKELMIGFFSRMVRKTPWVRMKIAASLDGKTALSNGQSKWITSGDARDDGHAWRARAGAVLTGIGTILADDPQLDVRAVPTQRQPHLVIVDSELRTPVSAKIFTINNIAAQAENTPARGIFIYTKSNDRVKRQALENLGVTVIVQPNSDSFDASGKVDLAAMMHDLAKREVNELHVEAGATLNGALISAGLVDEFLVYLAPKLLGGKDANGRGMADFAPLADLTHNLPLDFVSVAKVGPDVRLLARVIPREKEEEIKVGMLFNANGYEIVRK
ncbi:MAG: bifunctional diaminohydroxyphosphoribosylaminopyrimidine deaminase/5-amino-6-(5-phosphoribosylamino)uracil reductase RibD [Burkholderiaceae bacterium]